MGKKLALTPRKLGNLLGLSLTQAKLLTACLKKVDLWRPFYAGVHTEGVSVNGLWSECNYKVRFQKSVYNFRITHDGVRDAGWFGPCYIDVTCDGANIFRLDFPDVKTLLEFLNEMLQWHCVVE